MSMVEAVDPHSHMVFNYVMAVVSLFSNLLLVFLVKRVKVVAMGSYIILIYVSAVMDVVIALSNAIVIPVNIHMGKYSFVVFGVGTWNWPALPGLVSIYVFDLLFYQTFAILSYHFVYRYVVLLRASSLMARLEMWHWIFMGIVFEIFFNAVMTFFISHYEPRTDWEPDVQLVKDMFTFYGINMSRPFGHFHVVYAEVDDSDGTMAWNWPIVIYTLSILALIAMLGVVMLLCAKGVLTMMKSLSAVIQTVVPLVISFIPVGCLVLLPLTGSQFGALGNYLMSITTVYPSLDPLLLIICVQRCYRRKIYSWCEVVIPGHRRISKVSNMSQFHTHKKSRSASLFVPNTAR
ncbi:hypothetical protein PRIPAC_71040 [Pristionchus pacificus]|uniref:G protein-coupled receptor n=1 Tax=Pristionchus pacificus TaxID=54126 RepID=A0A2A6CA12_PRIPA|nr:hypothetical protein PRIPAC_71040 [Pristionchus pacificus]|eukprot:PDM74989.1 G protein-coupled receptor [Pristionchus pacificus]